MTAPHGWPAAWARRVGGALVRILYAARAVGTEHVPDRGPVLLTVNHTGFLDGALVVGMAPRPAHFLVYDKSFDRQVGLILRASGQIPLSLDRGARQGLSDGMEVLKRGGVLGIFPEGARGRGDLADAQRGVAWLALQSGAAVIPTACLGTRATGALADSLPRVRSRLVVEFGPALDFEVPQGVPGKQRIAAVADQIRVGLAEHVSGAARRHDLPLPTDIPPDLWD